MATFNYESFPAIAVTILIATAFVAAVITRQVMGLRALTRRRRAERARADRMRADLWPGLINYRTRNDKAQEAVDTTQRRPGPRVMCAIDSARPLPRAFELALALSARLGAKLIVTHAVSGEWPYSWRAVERVTALSTFRKLAEAGGVRIRIRRQEGDAARVVLLHARAHQPDFIVLGAHQPHGWRRLLFRSVADRVTDAARSPVVLVPPLTPASDRVRSVFCAVDLSAASQETLAEASDLAAAWGARLTVLHVVHESSIHAGHLGTPELSQSVVRHAHERIQAMVSELRADADVRVTAATGSTHDEIVRVAVAEQADFIVAGPSQRSRVRRRLLGSTPIKVSRRAPCPVVVIPASRIKRHRSSSSPAIRRKAA